MFCSRSLGRLAPVMLCCVWSWAAPAAEVQAGPGLSGAWYDPAHEGEGWVVEILPGGRAVVYWFTYPPPGTDADNAWIQGVGEVIGNEIRIAETVVARGARFGAAFDSGDLETEAWGSWTMTFQDCSSGNMTYDGPEGFGSGEFTLVRLSHVQGTHCSGAGHSPGVSGFSGSWYDPATSGQGLTFSVLPGGQALAYWFTFDPAGNQAWLLALGESHGRRVEFPEVFAFQGTSFGDGFDTGAITAAEWGALSFTFDDCANGVLNYRGPDATWGAGWMPLRRLTGLDELDCRLPEPVELNRGRWLGTISMSPGLSEVAVTVLDGLAYIAGDLGPNPRAFLRFDPGRNRFMRLRDLPNPRDHAILVELAGDIYLMGGRPPGGGIAGKEVYRYDADRDRWRLVTGFPFPFGHTSGVAIGDYIYVVEESGTISRFDPRAPGWESLPRLPGVSRDHAASVAYRGELWWLAGRNSQLFNTNAVDIFDPVTGVWRPGPPMRFGRSGFAAAVVQDRIMVAGGEDIGSGGALLGTLEVYSPKHGWRAGPDMPVPVHGVGGAALLDRFYLLGGSTVPGAAGGPGLSQVYEPGGRRDSRMQ